MEDSRQVDRDERAEQMRVGIRTVLKLRDLTQKDACDLAGLQNASALGNFLSGRSHSLNVHTLQPIARALRLTTSQLIGEDPLPQEFIESLPRTANMSDAGAATDASTAPRANGHDEHAAVAVSPGPTETIISLSPDMPDDRLRLIIEISIPGFERLIRSLGENGLAMVYKSETRPTGTDSPIKAAST